MRGVPIRLRLRIDRAMRHVPRDADDRDPWILRTRQTQSNALANRIFVGPITRRHLLIDDGDRCRARLNVFCREIAAFGELNAECLQVIGACELPSGRGQITRIEAAPFDSKWIAAAAPAKRLIASEAG